MMLPPQLPVKPQTGDHLERLELHQEDTMIIHASITADDPQRTAETIARIVGGHAFPWMGPGVGTWIATADEAFGGMIEVLRRGSEFHPKAGEHLQTVMGEVRRHSGFHLMVETVLSENEVLAVAQEAGLQAYKARHGYFDVIEFWIDACFLLEVMTADMAAAYREVVKPDNIRQVRAALASGLTAEEIAAAARAQA